jgi:positive regulator of sigma E activity
MGAFMAKLNIVLEDAGGDFYMPVLLFLFMGSMMCALFFASTWKVFVAILIGFIMLVMAALAIHMWHRSLRKNAERVAREMKIGRK